jgi:hypothetical protein
MDTLTQKLLERLAGFAETDADREVYLNALGLDMPPETETERHARLLHQLRQGERAASLKAYLQLVMVADESVQRELRQIVRDRLYATTTDEQLRTDLLVYFQPPRVLELEDVKALLASCPDWFTEQRLKRAKAIQVLVAQRCEEPNFLAQMVEAIQILNTQLRSSNAAYAVLEALRNPTCALAVVRIMPTLRDQSTLQDVFKKVLSAERGGINCEDDLPLVKIKQKCPLTTALVGEAIAVRAEGELGSLLAMLLAAAHPQVVVRLVND